MTEKKGWGETVLGWFVERDGEGKAPETPAVESSTEAAEPPAAAPPLELSGQLPQPDQAGAPLDFPAVYRVAGVTDEAQDRVEKAITLLGTLPADASREVKRQIVEASLKAFGYPVEEIITASAAEIRALHSFIEFGRRSTGKVLEEANQRIEELKREIATVQASTEQKLASQQQLAAQCNQQKLRVQEVLEFFGEEAVARVVNPSGQE